MTESNETIEEADPEAENVSPEDNTITATESDSNSEEESTDENPFFAKIGCQLQRRRNYSLSRKT